MSGALKKQSGYLRFGIPSLDELFSPELRGEAARQLSSDLNWGATSLCLIGSDGTGKSVFGMHLASRYFTDNYSKRSGSCVIYVSTDLQHHLAKAMWKNFGLDRPTERDIPFEPPTYPGPKTPLQVELRELVPFVEAVQEDSTPVARSLADFLSAINRDRAVGFVDLASRTAGDDWGFVNRLLATLPESRDPPKDDPPHLMIIDAVEGFETLVGEVDAHGLPTSRRSRIAQIMRSAGGKCHVVFIVEEDREGAILPEEFVADSVIRLRSTDVKGYMRRTIEVEKTRGKTHVRGRHTFVMRGGVGSMTRGDQNPDDPAVQLTGESGKMQPQSYIHVFPSVQYLGRKMMSVGERRRGATSGVVEFGIAYLDPMLKTVDADPPSGLPRGQVTALIGEAWTRKSTLGRAFLSRCYQEYPARLKALRDQLLGNDLDQEKALTMALAVLYGKKEGARLASSGWEEIVSCLEKTAIRGDYQASRRGGAQHARWRLGEVSWLVRDNPREGESQGRFGLGDPNDGAARVAAWLLAATGSLWTENDGVAVLMSTKASEMDSLGLSLARTLPLYDTFDAGLKDALTQSIEASAVCRRFEINDMPSAVLAHITKQVIEEASARLAGVRNSALSRKRASHIRVVIDDLRNLQDMYPSMSEDPLLLPYLLSYLEDAGVTTLLIHTQLGRPQAPPQDKFDREVRALVDRNIYTWRVPFYGQHRMAISVIPSFGPESVVREIRWTEAETAPSVDPHFELYRGLEEGHAEMVPLKVRLYQETPNCKKYIDEENDLFSELFKPPSGERVIGVEKEEEYDDLRDLAVLQGDTRLDHTLVLQVDEFWRAGSFRLDRSLRDQRAYLLAVTNRSGQADGTVDPYHVFQPSEPGPDVQSAIAYNNDRGPFDRSYYFRRYYRDASHFEGPAHSWLTTRKNRKSFIGHNFNRFEAIPFTWDFGFLLLRSRPWLAAMGLQPGNQAAQDRVQRVKRAWKIVREPPQGKRISWRDFFEACDDVAQLSSQGDKKVGAFDVSMLASETFSCLVLEIWAPEIHRRHGQRESHRQLLEQIRRRHWFDEFSKTPTTRGLIEFVQLFPLELFQSWMLLIEVLDVGSFSGDDDFFPRQRKASTDAVAVRHWYSSASQISRGEGSDEPYVPVGLPGHFSVRGDWFLGVAEGSQSGRLGERALDLLCSRRANVRRLQLGIGLPTRDDFARYGSEHNHRFLRTSLATTDPDGHQHTVDYEKLKELGKNPSIPNFHWLFRSGLRDYDSHARIWRKWLFRMLAEFDQLRKTQSWLSGFSVYDALAKGVAETGLLDSYLQELPDNGSAARSESPPMAFQSRMQDLEGNLKKVKLPLHGPSTVGDLPSWLRFREMTVYLLAALRRATLRETH